MHPKRSRIVTRNLLPSIFSHIPCSPTSSKFSSTYQSKVGSGRLIPEPLKHLDRPPHNLHSLTVPVPSESCEPFFSFPLLSPAPFCLGASCGHSYHHPSTPTETRTPGTTPSQPYTAGPARLLGAVFFFHPSLVRLLWWRKDKRTQTPLSPF